MCCICFQRERERDQGSDDGKTAVFPARVLVQLRAVNNLGQKEETR